ncbi:APC family permease, partial [Lactobacillus sp. XV13L]|nr:APC family permease [Lactobacillus sp. XV13L]
SIPPKALAHGWQHLTFDSPFADLAILLGINWLAVLLYIDAFVSPFGTGVSFVASAARALSAMEGNGHLPHFLGKLNHKYQIPRAAMVINTLLSMVMVAVFRSWSLLATVLSAATLIAYLTGPVTAVSLRKLGPQLFRPIRLKHLTWIAPFSFVLASLAIYWSMWPTTIEVIGIIMLGLPLYLFYEYRRHFRDFKINLQASWWLIIYLVVISLLSYGGSHEFGGCNWLSYPWDQLVIIAVSLVFYYWGIHSGKITADFCEAEQLNYQAQHCSNIK